MNLYKLPSHKDFPKIVDAVVEIPKGKSVKYEYDPQGYFRYDRSLTSAMVYPASYGFIPSTMADDGDALDILVYLNSFHQPWEYVKCPQTGNWVRKSKGKTAPLREGYRMCYGGQGDANSMDFDEFHELVSITEALRDFLVEVIIPTKNGEVLDLVA